MVSNVKRLWYLCCKNACFGMRFDLLRNGANSWAFLNGLIIQLKAIGACIQLIAKNLYLALRRPLWLNTTVRRL